MNYKLGCLPGRIPAGLKDLTYYAAGSLPKAPASVAVPPIAAWGMDSNDIYGDCGVAGLNHGFMADAAIAGETEGFPDDPEIAGYYFAYTGNVDSGVVLSDFLAYVRKTGFFGHTVSAYAPVAVHDIPTLQFAVDAYGFAYTGIRVTQAMMNAVQQGVPWQWNQADTRGPVLGGHCLALGTKVLTDSLQWAPIEELQPGDGLIAFDENSPAPGKRRKFRKATVEATRRLMLPCYELEFDDGTTVTAAYDHLWLMARATHGRCWVRTDQLRAGAERASKMYKLFDVWKEDHSWEAGYLAAAFDGEGWIDGNANHIRKLGFAQRSNEMLDMTARILKEKGFGNIRQYLHSSKSGYGDNPVYNIVLNTRRESVRFLGTMRPQRLLGKFHPDRLGAVNGSPHVTLVRKTFVGDREVIALQTDTRTYIAEGLPSHNCIPVVGYDDTALHAVTWGQVISVSYSAWHHISTEAWAVLTGEFRDGDNRGISLPALCADLAKVGS